MYSPGGRIGPPTTGSADKRHTSNARTTTARLTGRDANGLMWVLQKVNRQLYPDIKEDMFISMAYLVLDHVRRYSVAQGTTWCCEPITSRLTAPDYLDFLESVGTDSLVRRAYLVAWAQALPQEALDFRGIFQ